MDCLFCKIAAWEIPSKKLFEDDELLAFYDVSPQAPIHFLVIPKAHIASANDITAQNSAIVARVYEVVAALAKELNLAGGYRVVTNCGEHGGQTVNHLHFHVLAGRSLAWPPG